MVRPLENATAETHEHRFLRTQIEMMHNDYKILQRYHPQTALTEAHRVADCYAGIYEHVLKHHSQYIERASPQALAELHKAFQKLEKAIARHDSNWPLTL